ncbi:hypothetical protein D5E69_14365 [Rossellomorea marisflavi]|uniref:hypothetical protein n=1 Tax=Rossellomorea marisflavi TaxID=189381 RepID=UPI001318EEC9|nr:hypothetical protein [Rossellomorea marisflavi]QHA36883.1 hypothetical protein D5E69_14365 [Rossellomorea marisflavi]
MKKLIVLIAILFAMLVGCSNESSALEAKGAEIREEIVADSEKVYDTLQDAMNRTVQYGAKRDFGVLTTEEYEENVQFFLDEDHYFGYKMKKEEYTDDEYRLLKAVADSTMTYLEYVQAEILGDEASKEQVLKSFNRNMDRANGLLNTN